MSTFEGLLTRDAAGEALVFSEVTLECAGVATGTDLAALLVAAASVVAPVFHLFHPDFVAMLLTDKGQAERVLDSFLRSESVPDLSPEDVAIMVR